MQSTVFQLKIHTVFSNCLLKPSKAVFFQTFFTAFSIVIDIHINETIAFAHLMGGGTDDIDRSPGIIASDINPIINCFFHLLQMFCKIITTIVIVDTIFLHCILRSQAIFSDINRALITIIKLVQADS